MDEKPSPASLLAELEDETRRQLLRIIEEGTKKELEQFRGFCSENAEDIKGLQQSMAKQSDQIEDNQTKEAELESAIAETREAYKVDKEQDKQFRTEILSQISSLSVQIGGIRRSNIRLVIVVAVLAAVLLGYCAWIMISH